MSARSMWVGVLGLTLAASGVACGGSTSNTSSESSAPAAAPAGQKVEPATAGEVKGIVSPTKPPTYLTSPA